MKKKYDHSCYSTKFNNMIQNPKNNRKSQQIIYQSSINQQKQMHKQNINKTKNPYENIEEFVNCIGKDPSILKKLLDYKQLIKQIKESNNELKSVLDQKKQQLEYYKNKLQQLIGQNNKGIFGTLKKKQKQIQQEIFENDKNKKYIAKQQQVKKYKKTQQSKYIKQNIKQANQNGVKQVKQMISKIKKLENSKLVILEQIASVQKNNSKLLQKFKKNKTKQSQIQLFYQKFSKKQQEISLLKKKQRQQLDKYRQNCQKKKSLQQQLKNATDKKLIDFVKKLSKIIQTINTKQFQSLLQIHQGRKGDNKRQSLTDDSKSDDNSGRYSDDEQRQKQLLKMQNQYPILKGNRIVNIPSTPSSRYKFQLNPQQQIQYKKQFDNQIIELQNKLLQLNKIQNDLDQEIDQMKKKVGKLDKQINQ